MVTSAGKENKNPRVLTQKLNGAEGEEVVMFRVCQVSVGSRFQTEETTYASSKA